MTRSTALTATLAMILPLTACASTPVLPQIDSAYRITGAAQAAPVQAFSLHGSEYLQLRNIKAVPAPMTPAGQPLRYRVYDHYLVVPRQPEIVLHYGTHTATVTAAGAASPPTATVQVAENAMRAAVIQPAPVSAATTLPAHYLPPPVTPAGVTGGIHAGRAHHDSPSHVTLAAGKASAWLHQHTAFGRQGVVLIEGDGGVTSAKVADALMQTCVASHRACRVRYRGAPRGKIILEIQS